MAIDYSRVHRLLRIVTLIQNSRGWTARKLARECGTTERTIYRDMKMLDAAGIPYFYDSENRCYSIRKDFFLPPVQLTLEEALSVEVLAEQVGGLEQIPFTRAAARAVSKVRGQLPPAIRRELERMERRLTIRLGPVNPPECSADVYDTMQWALSCGRVLRCEYDTVNQTETEGGPFKGPFLFRPYSLFFCHRAWYVVGHHGGRRAVRCLKLNRFTRIERTEQVYDVPRDFSLERHFGLAWRMIRGSKRYDVELWFDPQFAETVADTQWHSTQEVIWNRDDSITFRCRVDGLDEIVWWVLGMGPYCKVHKPRELAVRVRDLAAKIVALYPTER